MAFLIDTNVISETLKSRPEAKVIDWLGGQKANDLFLASVSLGELVRPNSMAVSFLSIKRRR